MPKNKSTTGLIALVVLAIIGAIIWLVSHND